MMVSHRVEGASAWAGRTAAVLDAAPKQRLLFLG
jgi:hypothetical protein